MQAKQWLFKLIASILVGVYLFRMPPYLEAALEIRTYDDKFFVEETGYTGVITVWHVVGFKPYSGSLTAAVSSIAKSVEAEHYGVFFEITGMDEAEYAERTARGDAPDVLSFPLGLCYPDQFRAMDVFSAALTEDMKYAGQWEGNVYAVPSALSAHTVLVNTGLFQERGVALPEGERDEAWLAEAAATFASAESTGKGKQAQTIAGDAVAAAALGLAGEVAAYDAFQSGKAALAIADLRAAGELSALQTAGKGFAFEAFPLGAETALVQLLGIMRGIEEEKIPYAAALVEAMLSEAAGKTYWKLGMVPAAGIPAEQKQENAILAEAGEKLADPVLPNAFLAHRYRDVLEETAQRALSGDGDAKKELEARLKELVSKPQIK